MHVVSETGKAYWQFIYDPHPFRTREAGQSGFRERLEVSFELRMSSGVLLVGCGGKDHKRHRAFAPFRMGSSNNSYFEDGRMFCQF